MTVLILIFRALIDLMHAKDKISSLLYWMLIVTDIVIVLCIWSFTLNKTFDGITYAVMTIMMVPQLKKQFDKMVDSTTPSDDC